MENHFVNGVRQSRSFSVFFSRDCSYTLWSSMRFHAATGYGAECATDSRRTSTFFFGNSLGNLDIVRFFYDGYGHYSFRFRFLHLQGEALNTEPP